MMAGHLRPAEGRLVGGGPCMRELKYWMQSILLGGVDSLGGRMKCAGEEPALGVQGQPFGKPW